MSKNSLSFIYKVCDIHVYIDKSVLSYVITLPMISTGTFKAYRMIPIPVSLGNSKLTYISTEEPDLCIDQTRQYYFGISDTEFNRCKILDSQARICK
jgi:hypothetical protein